MLAFPHSVRIYVALEPVDMRKQYKALLVAPGHALGQVCHYIHLNPVRARLCEPSQVLDYRWSSLPKYVGKRRPNWLEARTVLTEAGDLPDSSGGWSRYVQYLKFLATDELAQKELIAEKMSRGWCVGDRGFKTEMKKAAAEQGAELERFAGLETEEVHRERSELWEERLQVLAHAAKIDLHAMAAKKSHPDKARLAAAMKLSCSVRNGWLADRLAMGKPSSASQFARRWLLDPQRKADTHALLSRVKT